MLPASEGPANDLTYHVVPMTSMVRLPLCSGGSSPLWAGQGQRRFQVSQDRDVLAQTALL